MNISIKEETLGQRIRLGMTQEELAEARALFSKITDPKVQEMLLKQIRALV